VWVTREQSDASGWTAQERRGTPRSRFRHFGEGYAASASLSRAAASTAAAAAARAKFFATRISSAVRGTVSSPRLQSHAAVNTWPLLKLRVGSHRRQTRSCVGLIGGAANTRRGFQPHRWMSVSAPAGRQTSTIRGGMPAERPPG